MRGKALEILGEGWRNPWDLENVISSKYSAAFPGKGAMDHDLFISGVWKSKLHLEEGGQMPGGMESHMVLQKRRECTRQRGLRGNGGGVGT